MLEGGESFQSLKLSPTKHHTPSIEKKPSQTLPSPQNTKLFYKHKKTFSVAPSYTTQVLLPENQYPKNYPLSAFYNTLP